MWHLGMEEGLRAEVATFGQGRMELELLNARHEHNCGGSCPPDDSAHSDTHR
jgi:hypothetical protein